MKLLKVQLDAIKSYQKQTVEFRPGTNSICGQNGAGKSTIVEAVGWALFDSLSYKQEQFIRDGARWGQVVVTFEARDGREYEVVRRAGSGAVWYITDLETQEKYTTGAADTRDWLRRNLIGAEDGVALNVLFENAVGVPQGGLCAPFLQTAQRRKESFDPILRVDEYEKAWQNLRETRSELDRRVQELELQAAGHARAAEELPAIEAEVLETNRVIAASAARHAELKREHARQSDRVAALRAAAEKIAALDQHVRTLEQIRDSIESVRANEQRQVDAAWEAHNVIERTSKNHSIYESADRRLRDTEAEHGRYEAARREHDAAERDLDRVRHDLDAVAAGITAGEEAQLQTPVLEARAARADSVRDQIAELRRLEEDMPKQRGRRTTAERRARDLAAEIAKLDERLAQFEASRPLAERVADLAAQRDAAAAALQDVERSTRLLTAAQDAERTAAAALDNARREHAGLLTAASVDPETERLAASLAEIESRRLAATESRTQLREQHSDFKARREALEGGCPLSREDCLVLRRASDEKRRLDGEMQHILAAGKEAKSLVEACDTEVAQARAANESVRRAEVVRVRLEAAAAQVEEREGAHTDVLAGIAEHKSATAKGPEQRAALDRLNDELAAARRAASNLDRIPDQLTNRAALEAQRAEQVSAAKDLMEAVDAAEARLAEQLPALATEADSLRSAVSELSEARLLVRRLAELSTRRDERLIEERDGRRKVEELVAQLVPLRAVEEERAEAERRRAQHRDDHEAYLRHHSAASELSERQMKVKTTELQLATHVRELDTQRTALAHATTGWDPQAPEQAAQELAVMDGALGKLAAEAEMHALQLARLDTRREAALEDALRRDELRVESQGQSDLIELLQFSRETIRSSQEPITRLLLHEVSQEARTIFCDVIDDHSVRLEWASDYEIRLERGTDRLSFHQLSGGEQMSAALAVRLALLKKLSDVDFAFLDEPTQNMDETRRTNLAQQIGSLTGFSQLFVISHDDTFEQQLSHAVMVRKQDGESVVASAEDEATTFHTA